MVVVGHAKCNAVDNWQVCNLKYKEHEGIAHDFVPRPKHKTHIEFNNVFVQCGWTNENVYDICGEDLKVLQVHYYTGSICTNCLKRYMFVSLRDSFLRLKKK